MSQCCQPDQPLLAFSLNRDILPASLTLRQCCQFSLVSSRSYDVPALYQTVSYHELARAWVSDVILPGNSKTIIDASNCSIRYVVSELDMLLLLITFNFAVPFNVGNCARINVIKKKRKSTNSQFFHTKTLKENTK